MSYLRHRQKYQNFYALGKAQWCTHNKLAGQGNHEPFISTSQCVYAEEENRFRKHDTRNQGCYEVMNTFVRIIFGN